MVMSGNATGKPDARIVTLIKRAAFELRLAADIARHEGYEPTVGALFEGARGNLRRCLRRVEGAEAKLDDEPK